MINTALMILAAATGPVQVKVDGEGYLRFAKGTQGVYAASASLVNLNGLICSADGYPLLPQIRLAPSASFSVSMDGTVTSGSKPVGRIILADFPANALQTSGKYWTATSRSQIGYPGEGILGIIRGSASMGTSSAAPVKASGKPMVEISLRTEIEKPEIYLGDVATIQASKDLASQIAAVDLGGTPIFGAERGITRIYVLAAMRHAGIDTEKIDLLCPGGAIALRKGQKVEFSALVKAAQDGVKQQLGVKEDLRADRTFGDLWVPTGELTLNTVQAVTSGDGYTANLEVDVDGKMITRRTVNLVCTTPAAKVQMGDPVKIRVIKNGATVVVQGKTRSAGRVGSSISVESEAGATFTGTLVTTGVVEVRL